ncbi:hypothetical protein [Adhaeribacter pallidiroseus]|uniref:Uncharacterized protein n=1 Tax=Adhaeribacter pallidiroseus TaxID=2072847 RepID=A0A369QB48_9BACT|nr:hypothetical protein [Adhaeribacter pallidiroseus]RDC61682.1 hypothetical protein AHMF7616_00262 [Adhaeribacter pallidiroseus]
MEFLYQLSLFLLLLSGACKPVGTSATTVPVPMKNSSGYRQLAESRLGGKVQYAFNETHTLVLGFSSEPMAAPGITHLLRFLVIALKDNRLLYEDQIANAQVEWYNNAQLKIRTSPGILQNQLNQPKNYYLYDLETQQKLVPGAQKL